jgi:hypothetical protein
MKVVAEGTITVPYTIYEYEVDGEVRYDYYDSDVLFESIEEAIQDFRDRHSS